MSHSRFLNLILPLIFAYCISGCKSKEPQIFESLPSSHTNITFNNTITTTDSLNALTNDYLYNGGGVAVGDINNDGLPDVYFTGNMVSSKLYLNKGNFVFEDITESAGVGTTGWATGVSMVDINGNENMDIYVCIANRDSTQSRNLFFINNGDNTFTERAAEMGLDDDGYSTQAAFSDLDLDGDLDMYLLTNAYESFNRNKLRPKLLAGEGKSTDRLYRNNGDGTFSEVSKEVGILTEGYGLGVAISDINQDGWPDIYVANDFITNDLMWINNGDGTFTDTAPDFVKHQSHNGMGVDVADFNNDGLPDIVVMDMLPDINQRQKTMFPNISHDRFMMAKNLNYIPQYVRNTLQLNNGNGTFSEIGQLAGIHATDWSWSTLFADFDNNGFRDLLITNGYRKDVTDLDFIVYSRENSYFGTEEANRKDNAEKLDALHGAHSPNFLYKNNGDLTFKDVSKDWGFSDASYSNGAAFADLDNDGDLDLIINNIDREAFIYKNNADKLKNHNFLQIKLKGNTLNTAGLGTKVIIKNKGNIQYHDHNVYRGYKSTVDDLIHFGLGDLKTLDSLIIIWPDGRNQVFKGITTNQRLHIDYKDALETPINIKFDQNSGKPLFEKVSNKSGLDYKHQNKENVDFKVQPLLPHKFSENGPGIAVGDVNGNGLEDFFIGGAAGYPGKLYLQVNEGQFLGKDITGNKPEEDMGALFFDADNDGDFDLYVVSGGSNYDLSSPNYQDRLYLNDGKGNFTLTPNALPRMITSGSCVIASDYDQDGDLDLFIGGRIVPSQYPMPAKSYILRNNGGKFDDVTMQVAPELHEIGLVTGALWTDFDIDGRIDLIIVGEWMPVAFFKNTDDGFKNITSSTGLQHSNGWWNSIAAGDFDEDGDIDYAVGNLGLNSLYKASESYPVQVYAKDYDKNGSIDPIMTHFIDGVEYPVHPRDNLIEQIAYMRGRFPRYEIYGKATMKEVLGEAELNEAYVVKSNNFQSSIIENKGGGKFEIKSLPIEAQFAPVFGILINDYDEDGHLDILLTGNSNATETQTGWYDASIGLYLKGDGKGSFSSVHVNKSGFFVDKNAKGMAELNVGDNKSLILVGCNNDSLQSYQYTSQGAFYTLTGEPDDAFAIITCKDGRKIKKEFYYGSAYLSQSSRWLRIPFGTNSVVITNYKGERRNLIIPEKNIGIAIN